MAELNYKSYCNNPKTGRMIVVGGKLWLRLVKEGLIKGEYTDSTVLCSIEPGDVRAQINAVNKTLPLGEFAVIGRGKLSGKLVRRVKQASIKKVKAFRLKHGFDKAESSGEDTDEVEDVKDPVEDVKEHIVEDVKEHIVEKVKEPIVENVKEVEDSDTESDMDLEQMIMNELSQSRSDVKSKKKRKSKRKKKRRVVVSESDTSSDDSESDTSDEDEFY